MKNLIARYWQLGFNFFLFAFFLDIVIHRVYEQVLNTQVPHGLLWYTIYFPKHWHNADWGQLHFIDWSFIVQNMIMCTLLLIRSRHKAVAANWWHQGIALFAFISGGFMIGTQALQHPVLLWISTCVIFAANLIGIISLLNLGRSFGILIALRKVKTGGLYSVVRHPMYCSDILLRLGFIIGHFSIFILLIGMLSIGCYVVRAILEERFLCRDEEYKDYMNKVRYRFIPFIF